MTSMPKSFSVLVMPAACRCGQPASMVCITRPAVKLPAFSLATSSSLNVRTSAETAGEPFGKPGTAWPVGESGSGSISAFASGGMLSGHL